MSLNPTHGPTKSPDDDSPFILTLRLDDESFAFLDGLRRQYFPPECNHIPAHITLFHALPSDVENEPAIRATLAALCAETSPFAVAFPKLRSLGRGVAAEVQAPALLRLRASLAESFAPILSPQDRQNYQPHVTIQNKATPDAARILLSRLSQTWQPWEARGVALLLWRYRGGPWEAVGEFAFAPVADSQ